MIFDKDFNHSYWEQKMFFKKHDLIVVGSGIVGLSAAISFIENNPKASVLILERGILPNGASTKNAGFACFGSAGEILADLKLIPEKTVWETVEMRWKGLLMLRKRLKDKNIDFQPLGGFELFADSFKYKECSEKLNYLNTEFKQISGLKNCYSNTSSLKHFANIKGSIYNRYEGQIDTGFMMKNLYQIAIKKGITVLNAISVEQLSESNSGVNIKSNFGDFHATNVIVATNGFAASLLKIKDVKPARAQVLITKPIPHLKIKGTFHFDEGYYYFRNTDNRILFGGGRHLDPLTETTYEQGINVTIQDQLDKLLKELILPGIDYKIDQRWSGIMGIGSEKKPIIEFYEKKIVLALRMGGMGVAIGSWVGKKAADLLE